MKADPEKIPEIRASFARMETKDDLVKALNLAKEILYGKGVNEFSLKNITYYADTRFQRKRYSEFQNHKKQGGTRTIHAPVPGLKAILRCLNLLLLSVYEDGYENEAMGFIPGKSIKNNAEWHTGKSFVFNIDLKDFFSSIDLYRVKTIFQLPPFNLKGEKEPLAYLMARLCCEKMEVVRKDNLGAEIKKVATVLPQGAPTSPAITNFIARKMDRRLKGVAKRFGVAYTRYADDITFSSNHNVYKKGGDFLLEVEKIISEQGFCINESKVRLQQREYRQEVTGLIVNEHPNVPRKFVKQMRQWIYLWEHYGYEKANLFFRRDYSQKAGRVLAFIPPLDLVLDGKLKYMKMVVGPEHTTWMKLNSRYSLLTQDRVISDPDLLDINKALESLFVEMRKNIDEFIAEVNYHQETNQAINIDDNEATD